MMPPNTFFNWAFLAFQIYLKLDTYILEYMLLRLDKHEYITMRSSLFHWRIMQPYKDP